MAYPFKWNVTISPGNKNQQRLCYVRTGLVYFVAQREARPLVGIVRHKLDVDWWPRRYDGRWGDVAAVLPQQVSRLWVPVVDLDVIVSTEDAKMLNSCSATLVMMFPKTKDWQSRAKIKSKKKSNLMSEITVKWDLQSVTGHWWHFFFF